MRSDGSRNEDFLDLIKEIRDKWMSVRSLKYLKASQWFGNGIEALQFLGLCCTNRLMAEAPLSPDRLIPRLQ